MTPEPPARPAVLPVSVLGLPETDPADCEIHLDVDRLGVVHAELASDDPSVVELR
ncbi:hypothetical protein GCM10010172_81520 [Paractinoplanes ferrugineus]|uniref:Uncharacterized protein n=1 Tax=Paractinoplanes ferrugineus TaxID=113564 RepID=A0A919MC80_9ACTN|nr:hypothetical protein [Actinoplanes ferrugineus]GIE10473.1 hypothetical protein Afe05nite_23130 [Actinoplanes ferrugineus]